VSPTVDGTPAETASRRAEQHLREEAAALAADPADLAEAAQIMRDMEALGTW
jgi:hypothetical protein